MSTIKVAQRICTILYPALLEQKIYVALTGGCLYKPGNRKDIDLVFYVEPRDWCDGVDYADTAELMDVAQRACAKHGIDFDVESVGARVSKVNIAGHNCDILYVQCNPFDQMTAQPYDPAEFDLDEDS